MKQTIVRKKSWKIIVTIIPEKKLFFMQLEYRGFVSKKIHFEWCERAVEFVKFPIVCGWDVDRLEMLMKDYQYCPSTAMFVLKN